MFNYLQKKGIIFAILVLGISITISAQPCDGQEEDLIDTEIPVTGVSSANPEAYCLYFRFDADQTGMPIGITMDLWHQYEGDLSIFIEACGERLNILQRPGSVGNCDAGCSGPMADCGSSAEIGTQAEPEIISFFDAGPDPENGISMGGSFGLSQDDDCGVSTLGVNSFAELWSNCGPGLVEAEICFTDHAFQHFGYVSNLDFIFPNPYVCGCMDPDAINYNPDANVSSGECLYDCPDLGLEVPVNNFDLCGGGDTITLIAQATLAVGPSYEWTSLFGQGFIVSPFSPVTDIIIPADYVGQFTCLLTVTDEFGCQEFSNISVNVSNGPMAELLGADSLCAGDSTWLWVVGGPFDAINWSTGESTDSIRVGPGDYAVTLSDQSVCDALLSARVTELPSPTPMISGVDTICFGTTTRLETDTSYANYQWSTGVDTFFVQADTAGSYGLTVTDVNGCSANTFFVLAVLDSLELAIDAPAAFCAGDTITLSAIAPSVVSPNHVWTSPNGQSLLSHPDSAITNVFLPADFVGQLNYILTVTDSTGCQVAEEVVLDVSAGPIGELLGAATVCSGDSTWLSLGGGPFDAINWSSGASTDSIYVGAGDYSVTISDQSACALILDTIIASLPLPVPTISGPDTICFATTTTLSTPSNFVTYQWSTTENMSSILADTAGTYGLTVTDTNNCSGTSSFALAIYDTLELNITGPGSFCAGDTISLSASAGYTNYLWSTGETTATARIFEPGNISVTVTAANGCSATASFIVTENNLAAPLITGPASLCLDSLALLSVPAIYASYQWSNAETTPSISVAEPGLYNLTVMDTLGCSAVASFNLAPPVPIIAEIIGETLFCAGSTTNFTATDGFVNYAWSNGSSTQETTINQAGNYQLTVTNASGCSAILSTEVDTHPLQMPLIMGDEEICAGASTTLTLNGDFSDILWSTNESGSSINVASTDTYSLAATDSNGCPTSASFSVLVRTPIEPEISGDTQLCLDENGMLQAPAGFSTYAWTGGETEASLPISEPGLYELTVTDDFNCSGTAQVVVSEAILLPTIEGATNFCFGTTQLLSLADTFQTYQWADGPATNNYTINSSGTYVVTVTNATGCAASTSIEVATWDLPTPTISGPLSFCQNTSTILSASEGYLSYNWSVPGQTTASLEATQAGLYTLTVTDNNGCQGSDTVSLSTLALPEPIIVGILDFCPDGSTTLSSATPFVNYNWSTGDTTESINTSQLGEITLTVTDDNNCSASTAVATSLFATEVPEINGLNQFCAGSTTSLSVTPSFASYTWSDGQTGNTISTALTGNVAVTVTDDNNCQTESSVLLTNYEPASLLIGGPTGFCQGGGATLSVVDTFTNYLWSNGSVNSTIDISMAGDYTLMATDNNGCPAFDTFQIEAYSSPVPVIEGLLTICADGSTELMATGGDFSTVDWSTGEMTPSITVNTIGAVSLTVTDQNGCSGSTTENITEVASLSPELIGNSGICPGESTVIRTVNNFSTYTWSDGSTADSLLVSTPGEYSLTVTNSQGCSGMGVVMVVALSQSEIDISGQPYFCTGSSTMLTASENMLTYNWSTGEQTPSISVTTEDTYFLTVTNAEGCAAIAQQLINELELPNFSLDGTSVFCNDSLAILNVTPAYPSYSWSTGEGTQSISVNAPGLVVVDVTDEFGCTATESIELATVPNPMAVAGEDQQLDCVTEQIQLGSQLTSQGNNLIYEWTGPGITTANSGELEPWVNEAGNYSLMVTDTVYGCVSAPADVLINDLSYEPTVVLSLENVLDCSSSSVVIDASDSDQGPAYLYQWYDADNNAVLGANGLSYAANIAQDYRLEIIDTLTGCSASASITVVSNEAYPIVEAGPDQQLDCTQLLATLSGNIVPNEDFIVLQWIGPAGVTINPDNEENMTTSVAGWYYLQATDINNGCTNMDSVLVTQDIEQPIATTSGDVELTCDESETLLSGIGSSQGPAFDYQWLLNGVAITSANNLQFQASEPGIYSLEVNNLNNNCSTISTLNVTLDPTAPQAVSVVLTPPICAGDTNGSIVVSGVEGGLSPYSYSLADSPFVTTSLFNNLAASQYELLVEDANGCQIASTLTLTDGNDLNLDLGEDQTIEWGEATDIYPFLSIDSTEIGSLQWTPDLVLKCPECLYQQNILLDETTRFRLQVTDENGCITQDDILIIIEKTRDIYVPNVFSPNGDGNNDIFYIFTDRKNVKEVKEMMIFTRWGEPIFENHNFQPDDPLEGWDGRMRGTPLNPAVFTWFAVLEMVDGEIIKLEGDVTILK